MMDLFSPTEVHKQLQKNGFIKEKGEWFRCGSEDVLKAINSIKIIFSLKNLYKFSMRPEQLSAVNKLINILRTQKKMIQKIPHFFGSKNEIWQKYHLSISKKNEMEKILILTSTSGGEFNGKRFS